MILNIITQKCNEAFPEPVFVRGNFSYNNAPFDRRCPVCDNIIHAKSVHQKTEDGCRECKIHIHRYYYDTGNCINRNCLDKLSKEYMNKLTCDGKRMMFATKSWIEMAEKDGLMD